MSKLSPKDEYKLAKVKTHEESQRKQGKILDRTPSGSLEKVKSI